MDELLELIARYDCHLEEKSMVDFFNNKFELHLVDLRKLSTIIFRIKLT